MSTLQHIIRNIFLTSIFLTAFVSHAKTDDNIIISNAQETYTIIATKDGLNIDKVKSKIETTYTAQRVDEKIVAGLSYNNFSSIDKASAPGAKPLYIPDYEEGIFYDDTKVCLLYFNIKAGENATAKFEKTYNKAEYFTSIGLSESFYIKQKTVKLVIPQSLANRIKIVEKSFTPNITSSKTIEKKGDVIYTYEITDHKAHKSEVSSPELSTIIPRIYIYGQFSDVQELYNYFKQYTLIPDPEIETVNSLARRITTNCSSNYERIKNITYWIQQNIRYIAVEHGEYGQRPDIASEVLRKRYGDCKGMSNLLKAMLMAVGIDSRLTWIGTSSIAQRWNEVPNISSGNHMICSVIDGDSILFLDGTTAHLPIGYYSPSIQGQQALIENGDSYILKDVPIQSPNNNCDSIQATFKIERNNLTGEISKKLSGTIKMRFCTVLNSLDASKRQDFISAYLQYPRKNVSLTNTDITGDNITSHHTTLSATVTEQDACQHLNDAIYIDLLPIRNSLIDTYDLKDRQYDIQIPHCQSYVCDITIKIPDGFITSYIPDNFELHNEWFSLSIKYETKANTITCKTRLSINNKNVTLEKGTLWNTFARQVKQANSEQITLIVKQPKH